MSCTANKEENLQKAIVKIKEAAAYFDITLMDHIIVSNEGYYSFADEGLL